jgi:sialic acid synthase SpsE
MKKENYFNLLSRCLIVAEIGVNHNGNIDLAEKLVLEAKKSGADAVKFQTFSAETLVTKGTPKVDYQRGNTSPDESHFEMIKKLELGRTEHVRLLKFCNDHRIEFVSTPYDINSAIFLNDIGVNMFKTASADLVDLPLQRYIASTGKPAMVATGMANLGEVEETVNIFDDADNNNLLIMHCVSNYPCSDASLNLRALNTLNSAFEKPVGYSDHSEGAIAASLSVAIGVKVIEKHFTIDKFLPGPDHKASSTPDEFLELVTQIRRAELMLGSRKKFRQVEEQQMAQVSRKSLVLSHRIEKGDIINESSLCMMRPGTGIEARFIKLIVGKRANKTLPAFDQLRWTDIDDSQ